MIGQDGTVFQLVRLHDTAWGNGIPHRPSWPLIGAHGSINPNRYTLSIEHAKHSTDNSDPLTEAQLRASVALVGWLLAELPRRGLAGEHLLAGRDAGDLADVVIGHDRIDSVNRAHCPGTWDWDTYRRLLGHAPRSP